MLFFSMDFSFVYIALWYVCPTLVALNLSNVPHCVAHCVATRNQSSRFPLVRKKYFFLYKPYPPPKPKHRNSITQQIVTL